MSNKVFFSEIDDDKLINKENINKLIDKSNFMNNLDNEDNVAIKIDFNDFINSKSKSYVKHIIDYFNHNHQNVFVTDCNKLYNHKQISSVEYIKSFLSYYECNDIPVIVSDGLNGNNERIISQNDEKKYVSGDIYDADALIVVSFVKIKDRIALSGSLSNLSDCSSLNGKISYHKNFPPFIAKIRCLSCKECINKCPEKAIELKGPAEINKSMCVGCNSCIEICPTNTIKLNQFNNPSYVEETCKYCNIILNNKKYNKVLYINILTDIQYTKNNNYNPMNIVDDIGVILSYDAVAVDKASYDLINNQRGCKESPLGKNYEIGEDKIKGVLPNIDSSLLFDTAEKLKIGSKEYELIKN